jgi:periplasmic protein TonB
LWEGRGTTHGFDHLVLPASDRMVRHRQGALVASLVAHGLALAGLIWLLRHVVPPVPPQETSVSMVFTPRPDAAPAAAENPAPAHETVLPPTPEPKTDEPPPPAPPVQEATPAPAPSEPRREAAVPITPPHTLPQRPPPRPQTAARAPMPAAPTAITWPSATAASAAAPLLPAHPVAGMESDRPPAYPESARRRGQQGRVVLQVSVSPDGLPVTVSVAQSSGYSSLDAAALTAVQRWRFVPATRAGAPVAATAEVPVTFRLVD